MLIQYHNDLNTVSFKNFTLVEHRLFIAMTHFLFNQKNNVVEISLKELKKVTRYNYSYAKLFDDLMKLKEKTHSLELKGKPFIFYDVFIVNKEKKTLEVSITDEFMYLLNPLVAFLEDLLNAEPDKFF